LGKNQLKYEERLKLLNLKSLKHRREISILKIVNKIKVKHKSIPTNWLNKLEFYSTSRNGVRLKTNKSRINLVDKGFFNNAINLFNDSPMFIRDEYDYKKIVKYLNDM
jgi:hypothetical protein